MEAVAREPASSTSQLIKEICQDYASWAPELRAPPTAGKNMAGGYNHYLQILEGPGHRWVLRIATNNLRSSKERKEEARVQCKAAESGLAPRVRFSDPRRGITIMEYLDRDEDSSGSIDDIARLLEGIHALPPEGKTLHSPEVFRHNRRLAESDSSLARLLKNAEARINGAINFLDRNSAFQALLCHNDLLSANRIHSDGCLFALDWEYASPGDPFFDLAVCASELSDKQARQLVSTYLARRPTDEEKQRFAAQSLLYACIEACWHSVNQPHSPQAQASHERLATLLQREHLQ